MLRACGKNAQDRLNREAQEKSEETRQQLEKMVSVAENWMPLWTKRQKREVMRSIRHWQIAELIRQWHKNHAFYHQPDCLHSDICGGISGSSYYLNVLDLVVKLPVLKGINRFLGMLAGSIKGFLIVWVVFYLIHIMATTDLGTRLVTYIGENEFLAFLYQHNLLVQIFAGIF